MATSYSRAIRSLAADERTHVRESLARWATHSGIGRVVVPNLRDLERFLPKKDMIALLRVIMNYHSRQDVDLEIAYEKECHRHTGRGGAIRVSPLPSLVGRAVDKELFINSLHRNHRTYFIVRRHAAAFVEKLTSGEALTATEKELLQSEYVAWVTFNPESSEHGHPFSFRSRSEADEVRACLGLDPKLRNRLLLLVCERPANRTLKRPTVADAALFVFFQPPPTPLSDHGWTRPWPGEFLPSTLEGYVPQPRPEALHLPIAFKYLRLPVEELT